MVTNVENFGDSLIKRQLEIHHYKKNTTTLESSYAVVLSLKNIGKNF